MQWLINEWKDFRDEIRKKVDSIIEKHVEEQIKSAEEVRKLKGEIMAMKARMGKKAV